MTLQLTGTIEGQHSTWPLEADALSVGRSSKSAIHLPDATVSKTHAEILRSGGRWTIRDLGSRNGTRVNGVEAHDAIPFGEGDTLEIGKVALRVASDSAGARTVYAARDLSSSLKRNAVDLLTTPSGSAESPRFVKLLAEAGQLLVLPRPLRETCDEILRFVERAVPATRLVLLLRDVPGEDPVQFAARARGGRTDRPLGLSRSILHLVLDECTSVVTSDATLDPRFHDQQSIVLQGVHSAMAVPLFDNQRVLGALYADSAVPGISFDEEQLQLFTVLANMAAVKITNARLLEAEQVRQRMAQELATATRIQRALLPPAPPDVPGWVFDARLESCHEVGGDLYDFHRRSDGRVVVVVGDVSGKGLGAALLMSSVLSSARVLYDSCPDPVELVTRLNGMLHRSSDPGHFVTLFVAVIDPTDGAVLYVNAGHNPPLVLGAGSARTLEAGGVPVGILPEFPFEAGAARLEPGETLAMFSDGIPEAKRGDEFYDDARLVDLLKAYAVEPVLERVGDAVVGAVDEFLAGAPRSDDLTLVLVRRA
jgi:serine phosphatase RsbU (regulator of sigma subunit)/pSer/pThr/pTyr-binding forkhead associated (FHA) protein